jgi:hypothetical protein
LKCAGHVSHTGRKKNAYGVLVGRVEVKGLLEKLGRTRNYNIKLITKEILCFADRAF